MATEKKFKPSFIFDPVPSYDGKWFFIVENLLLNSKEENGINLFQQFYEKNFLNPLKEIFGTEKVLEFSVGFDSVPNEDRIGRCLKFSKSDFFQELTVLLYENIDTYKMTDEEKNNFLLRLVENIDKDNDTINMAYYEALKNKLEKLEDLVNNEINSEYFDIAMVDYVPYKNEKDFTTYIKEKYEYTKKLQEGMLKLGNFFDRKIDYEKLSECFDEDVFYLLFAKIIYDINISKEKQNNKLHGSSGYLSYYLKMNSEMISQNKNNIIKIIYNSAHGEKNKLSQIDILNDINELINRHPEAEVFMLSSVNDTKDYKSIDLMERIVMLSSLSEEDSWKKIPDTEKIPKGTNDKANMRIDILENSEYIDKLKGLKELSGYYAFVYANGKVILEKIWQNEESKLPVKGYATYFLDIDDFIEMTKIPEINIVNYIKENVDLNVKRIFHTTINNWQRNIYNVISGTYEKEDAIAYINDINTQEEGSQNAE